MKKKRKKPQFRGWTRDYLICIDKGINYGLSISKELDKAQPTVQRQLVIMKEEGLLKSKRKKLLNMRIFGITDEGKRLLNYFKELEKLRNKYPEFKIKI